MRCLIALLLLCLVAGSCWATTISPLGWEQLVLGADLVAVVECTTAGGIVAKYRVIESFRGPKAGSEIAISVAVNYWEPQYPMALVGQRFFFTAYKSPPSTIMSTTLGGPVPLWWRKIPADYQTPLFQGVMLMPSGESSKRSASEAAIGVASMIFAGMLGNSPPRRRSSVSCSWRSSG